MYYVIDTNILTAILKDDGDVKTKADEVLFSGDNICINCVTYYEIKKGLLFKDAKRQMQIFEHLCTQYDLILFDELFIFDKAAEIYAELRKNGTTIEDTDIFIASLASITDSILVTDNTRHFEPINVSNIENWINNH